MYFVRNAVAMTESTTVEQEISVSGTLYQSIMTMVPISVRIPESSELSDCETIFEMLSASFVMRLMRSPCE